MQQTDKDFFDEVLKFLPIVIGLFGSLSIPLIIIKATGIEHDITWFETFIPLIISTTLTLMMLSFLGIYFGIRYLFKLFIR